METVVANVVGKARRETLYGREFLVVPVVSIVPGVLNGSKGPLRYSDEVVGANVSDWDGMPIVGYHPTIDGRHVSARRPDVLNERGLGFFFNSAFSGKLTHEAWYDRLLTERFDQKLPADKRIVPRILKGEPIEGSTGLFTADAPAANGASHNGRAYTHDVVSIRPDHFATLPDQVGACSVKDGCGINVNAAGWTCPHCGYQTDNAPEDGKCPECKKAIPAANAFCPTGPGGGQDNSCSSHGGGGDKAAAEAAHEATTKAQEATHAATGGNGVPLAGAAEARRASAHGEHAEAADWHEDAAFMHKSMSSTASPRAALHAEAATAHEAAMHAQIQAAGGVAEVAGAMTAKALRLSRAADAAQKSGATREATEAAVRSDQAVEEGRKSLHHDAAAAHERAAEKHDPLSSYAASPDEKIRGPHSDAVLAHVRAAEWHRKASEKATNNQGATVSKAQHIEYLVANCDCWKGQGDKETLNAMSDEKVKALREAAEKAGAATLTANALRQALAGNDAAAAAPAMTDAELMAKCKALMEKDKAPPAMAGNQQVPVAQPAGPRLSAEEAEDLAFARAEKNRLKGALVARLVGNVADDAARQAKAQKLMAKGLAELQELAELVPVPEPATNAQHPPPPTYYGAAGAYAGTHNAKDDSDNVLPETTVNFDEMASPALRRATA